MNSQNGLSIIINGWKTAEIYNALVIGVSVSPSVNPFEEISPLASTYDSTSSLRIIDGLTGNLRENFVNGINDKKNPSGRWATMETMLILKERSWHYHRWFYWELFNICLIFMLSFTITISLMLRILSFLLFLFMRSLNSYSLKFGSNFEYAKFNRRRSFKICGCIKLNPH